MRYFLSFAIFKLYLAIWNLPYSIKTVIVEVAHNFFNLKIKNCNTVPFMIFLRLLMWWTNLFPIDAQFSLSLFTYVHTVWTFLFYSQSSLLQTNVPVRSWIPLSLFHCISCFLIRFFFLDTFFSEIYQNSSSNFQKKGEKIG